jgi:endonuclease/exonuclease/phosphatase family metal-dependent hydrolase
MRRMPVLGTISLLAVSLNGLWPAERAGGQTVSQEKVNRFGQSAPLPRSKGAIRLATYNTLNLFDHVDDPSLQGEFDDFKNQTADARCAELAKAIRAIDADIIALQEVESLEALTWFRDTFLKDMGYMHLASKDVGYYRGVECSIMSRHRITDVRIRPDESLDDVKRAGIGWSAVPADKQRGMKFQRSPLMVDIEINDDYTVTVFALHHKAGREFDYQREAEALQIIEYITALREQDPTRNIVVMGDFNAAPFDKSLRTYLEAGMIDTLAHRTVGQNQPEAPLYKTHESDRVLDYILFNSATHREMVIGSAFVYGTLHPGDAYDYRTDPHPPGYASDHYPVVVELMPREQP